MLSREDIVVQSAMTFVRGVLSARYPVNEYVIRDSFPYVFEENALTQTMVAGGFNFDDEGKQAEMGSDLMHRTYTIEYWVFGPTLNLARNYANVIKFALENQQYIPLRNIAEVGAPAFDTLLVEGVSTTRQIAPNPEPWQEFVFTTTAKCLDEYFASQSFPIT